MPVSAARPGDPQRLGPYRCVGRLGAGGAGTVHLAVGPDGRAVALKVLHREHLGVEGRRRFAREVEVLRRLRGPHLAQVLDADVDGPVPWIATSFVPGERLDEHVQARGPLGPEALRRLGADLAAALGAVHAAGVVHRDVTPGNVMLVDGSAVLIDFGVAHLATGTPLTTTGDLLGTVGYLAPEQARGDEARPETDVWGLGACLAFAGTGRPPFGHGRPEAVLYRVTSGEPDLAGLDAGVLPLVRDALSRRPGDRPSAADLAGVLASPSPALAAATADTAPRAPADGRAGAGPGAEDRTTVLHLPGRERRDAAAAPAAGRTVVLAGGSTSLAEPPTQVGGTPAARVGGTSATQVGGTPATRVAGAPPVTLLGAPPVRPEAPRPQPAAGTQPTPAHPPHAPRGWPAPPPHPSPPHPGGPVGAAPAGGAQGRPHAPPVPGLAAPLGPAAATAASGALLTVFLLATVAPGVVAVPVLLGLLGWHAVTRARLARARRRMMHGRRPSDVAVTVASSPGHLLTGARDLVGGLLRSLPVVVPAVVGVALGGRYVAGLDADAADAAAAALGVVLAVVVSLSGRRRAAARAYGVALLRHGVGTGGRAAGVLTSVGVCVLLAYQVAEASTTSWWPAG